MSATPSQPAADPLDALQAWALLLPAAILAWPGPGVLLLDVPTAISAGTGKKRARPSYPRRSLQPLPRWGPNGRRGA